MRRARADHPDRRVWWDCREREDLGVAEARKEAGVKSGHAASLESEERMESAESGERMGRRVRAVWQRRRESEET